MTGGAGRVERGWRCRRDERLQEYAGTGGLASCSDFVEDLRPRLRCGSSAGAGVTGTIAEGALVLALTRRDKYQF